MTTLLFGVLCAVTALVVRHFWQTVGTTIRRPRQPDTPGSDRTEECICSLLMPVSIAHLVTAAYDDEEGGTGGTVVSAAFCIDHCPGGCNHPEEHT